MTTTTAARFTELLSSRAAALSERTGPRMPMTVGPLVCALGTVMLLWATSAPSWVRVLPGMVVFALGLALLVSPLTASVLAAFVAVASRRPSGLQTTSPWGVTS